MRARCSSARAVREVDAGDIDARAEDRFEPLGAVGRRPERGHDLRAPGHLKLTMRCLVLSISECARVSEGAKRANWPSLRHA